MSTSRKHSGWARAPSRVNLVRWHTGYNDGFVLPTTIDRALYGAVHRRDDHEVSIAEPDHPVATARQTKGVYGARKPGAGFDESVVCLAADPAVSPLQRRLTERYAERFGREPTLYVVQGRESGGSGASSNADGPVASTVLPH